MAVDSDPDQPGLPGDVVRAAPPGRRAIARLYRLDRRYIGRDILTVVGGCFGGDIVPNYNRPFRAAHVFWLRHAPA